MPKNNRKPKILVILGPTASGKSALAVKLARRFNGEIISADSRQIYKGLDVGTGKITKKEKGGIPHDLLDVANPKNRFTVAKYQTLARRKIAAILRRGQLPIICGGTGFYISSLVDDIVLPDVPPNPKLRAELQKETAETQLNMLLRIDPRQAKAIDGKNPRRLIRAIEIALALGKVPILRHSNPPRRIGMSSGEYDVCYIGLTLPPKELKREIAIRLFARIRKGMIAEAERLHGHGLSWKRMWELGLEYRYLALYLQSKISRTEMAEKLQTEIWRYAKRQMTWFKRDKRIKWFEPSEKAEIRQVVLEFLLR